MTSFWDKLDADPLEEIEITLNGKTEKIMKADINVKFEGTYEEFLAWATTIFKDPSKFHVRVQFGDGKAVPDAVTSLDPSFEPGRRSGVSRRTFTAFSQLIGPQSWTNLPTLDLNRREDALVGIVRMLRENAKIQAIKAVREYTNCGLKEAKDFVESIEMAPALPSGAAEEIPF